MAQRNVVPCERVRSFLDDNARKGSWPDDSLVSNYHSLGPSVLSAATLFAGTNDRKASGPKK